MHGKMCITLFLLLLFGCRRDFPSQPVTGGLTLTFTFANDAEGWQAGFADYPIGEEAFYELQSCWCPLPPPLDPQQKAIMISGHNHSDDLFMFLKKKLSGLKPQMRYTVYLQVTIASQYPQNAIGIGGGPGSSVYLKVGATTTEPTAAESSGYYRMLIDKGNQAIGGKDMVVIGTIGIPGDLFSYTLIQRDNKDQPLSVISDAAGQLWVIVGTDSGFEGLTTVYYHTIQVQLVPTP